MNLGVELPPLTLAFIGDAVFTLYVRERLALSGDCKIGELTKRAGKLVSAVSQAAILEGIKDELTEEERDIIRRCRNAHSNNKAKNASIGEYRKATGLEGLIGYLYLSEQKERLKALFDKCTLSVKKEFFEK